MSYPKPHPKPCPKELRHAFGGDSTDGQYGLYRWDMPRTSDGLGAHAHRTMSASFYVLDGTVGRHDGDRLIHAKPGDFFFVPDQYRV
ncbi:hypothetical protein AB0J38_36905 [Streptomyces sp. NPDC050095]|uniref:hypothetical protein n=2 Tax=Streptomyces TaxID=1883 RepID=UPI00343A9C43